MDRQIWIRDAREDDFPVLGALFKTLAQTFITPGMAPESAATFLRESDTDAMLAHRANGHLVSIAEVDGATAGFITIRPPGHLFHLFVAQPFQRLGVARRLWDSARGEATQFTVNASPYAVPAYEALGFVCAGPIACVRGVSFQPMTYQRN
jgi:GNAT superfamily N-acetyltransferase